METTQTMPVQSQENTYQLTEADIKRINSVKAMKADIKALVETHLATKEQRKTVNLKVPRTMEPDIAAAKTADGRRELWHFNMAYAVLRGKTTIDQLLEERKTQPRHSDKHINKQWISEILTKYGR